mgnify:CR=1 FL=1
MAENTFKTNTFKKPEKEKKGKSSKSKGKFNLSLDFLKDPRFILATGFVLIITSIFLFISFVSFLFTWSADMSIIVPNGDSSLLDEAKEIQNWLGYAGAWASHHIIYNGFGIGSFAIPVLLFVIGFKTIKIIAQSTSSFIIDTIA